MNGEQQTRAAFSRGCDELSLALLFGDRSGACRTESLIFVLLQAARNDDAFIALTFFTGLASHAHRSYGV